MPWLETDEDRTVQPVGNAAGVSLGGNVLTANHALLERGNIGNAHGIQGIMARLGNYSTFGMASVSENRECGIRWSFESVQPLPT